MSLFYQTSTYDERGNKFDWLKKFRDSIFLWQIGLVTQVFSIISILLANASHIFSFFHASHHFYVWRNTLFIFYSSTSSNGVLFSFLSKPLVEWLGGSYQTSVTMIIIMWNRNQFNYYLWFMSTTTIVHFVAPYTLCFSYD